MDRCDRCSTGPCSCEFGPIINGRLPPLPPSPPCPCGRRPCVCGEGRLQLSNNVNEFRGKCTVCTREVHNNIWHQPPPFYFKGPGRCILDELTFGEVYNVLQKNPDAKKDLLRITTDPDLIALANHSALIQDPIESDLRATNLINKGPNSLPIYSLFYGNSDGSISGRVNKR